MNKLLISAVRNDDRVGHGSCTSIDECYEDEELWDLIKDCKTAEDAIKVAHEAEGLYLEQGLNARWGEDDDPQLKNWQEWFGHTHADEE